MSIYQSRAKRAPATGKQPEGLPPTRDETAPTGAVPYAPTVQDGARLRKASPVEYLLPASVKWFESLPPEVRPVALAAKYGRIVNLIVQQWNDYNACRAYFDELLTDRRGNRRGFPADARWELRALQKYYLRSRLPARGGLTVL